MASVVPSEPPCPYDEAILSKELEVLHDHPQDPPPYFEKPVRRVSQHKRKASSELVPTVAPKVHRPPKPRNACPACYYRYLRETLRAWVLSQRKPYSAVTVQIDRLTSEQYEESDLSGIVDLVEVIRIQESGPTEAARAIRKKLKYGNPHRQIRALLILDGLMQNAGSRFQRTFADEPLLERLRILPKDDMVDAQVRAKCNLLFRQWASAYQGTPGMERIATLYKQLPARPIRRPQPAQSKIVRETELDADHASPSSPTSHSRHSVASSSSAASRPVTLSPTPSSSSSFFKKDKKHKNKKFNLEKEKPQLLETIASANLASTNLDNALKLVNRENERVSQNQEVIKRFEACKILRRQILRYIQLVESDQYIGSLLSANDELVKALMSYEIMDKSIEDDSDSDAESFTTSRTSLTGKENELAGLSLHATPAKPARPAHIPMPPAVPVSVPGEESDESEKDVDDDDPFGDQNAVKTPYQEKGGMTWRDV